MNKGKWILTCVAGGIVFFLLFGLVTMWLWNWLVPAIFQGPELGYAEALGLLVLAKILFGGGWGGRRWGRAPQPSWKHRYFEKLSTMTPEERERFKSRMREKWSCGEPKEKTPNAAGSND